jgi:hypothetical protein
MTIEIGHPGTPIAPGSKQLADQTTTCCTFNPDSHHENIIYLLPNGASGRWAEALIPDHANLTNHGHDGCREGQFDPCWVAKLEGRSYGWFEYPRENPQQ